MTNNLLIKKPLKCNHIEEQLRLFISRLKANDKLPSERNLAESFKCSVLTVRRSILPLVDEGLLYRKVGSGTFVAENEFNIAEPKIYLPDGLNSICILALADIDRYGMNVVQAIAQETSAETPRLFSIWARELDDNTLQQVKDLQYAGCGSVIIPWFPQDKIASVQNFIRKSSLPVVIPQLIPGFEENSFEVQDIHGKSTRYAIEGTCKYFHKLGHKNIAFLGPDKPDNLFLQMELAAYTSYMTRSGLSMNIGLVRDTNKSMDELAARWLEIKGDLAIISYDDGYALRFMTAMHKLGLSAPDDYAITGYNNTDSCSFSDPLLTSLSPNYDYLGKTLIKSAQARLQGGIWQSDTPQNMRLIIRGSCGGSEKVARISPEIPRLILEVE